MAAPIYVTKERFIEMQEELQLLRGKGRKEIAQKIADARSHGDLSENADYDAAKHEQELMEIRLAKLETSLANAQVIQASDFPDDKIYILSKVKLLNKKTNKELEYYLVSAEEADFEQNKLSVSSPLGKSLMGKVVGDIVEMKAPAGLIQFEILGISK